MLCKGQTCGCANLDKPSSSLFFIAWKKSKTNKKIREIFSLKKTSLLRLYLVKKPTIFCHITLISKKEILSTSVATAHYSSLRNSRALLRRMGCTQSGAISHKGSSTKERKCMRGCGKVRVSSSHTIASQAMRSMSSERSQ